MTPASTFPAALTNDDSTVAKGTDSPLLRSDRRMPSWIKEPLSNGEHRVGAFLQLADPSAAEAMASIGFDFLCVEGEHSGLSTHQVQQLVAAVDRGGLPCLVRTPDGEATTISSALDSGAGGVVVPRVESAGEAAGIVASATYPPDGKRRSRAQSGNKVWITDQSVRG